MKSCTSRALPFQSAGTMVLGLKGSFITGEVCVGGSPLKKWGGGSAANFSIMHNVERNFIPS